MAVTLNASTSSGFVQSADTSGEINLQSNGTTELTVASTGVTVADNLLFNSGYGSAAVGYGVRAWVTFDGTGTPAITGSGNVSSITDGGTGIYTVNFTNSMPDVNYATVTGGCRSGTSSNLGSVQTSNAPATGNVTIWTYTGSALVDWVEVNVAVIR